ncbi:MAG: DUF3822 family protein, partial [Flavobacteriaceae bacterium]|nr:DUF3822 family protein [Flavobacteriaceae bacterium]
LDGFSFCILNKDLKEITALYSFDYFENNLSLDNILKNIQQIVLEEPLLRNKYQSVNITFKNKLNTFVPLELFDEQFLSNYLQHTIKVFSNDFVAHDIIDKNKLVNVYIPFVNITNFFLDYFGPFNYKHAGTVLVEKLIDINNDNTDIRVYVQVSKNDFEVIVLKQNELILYNSFTLNTNEDFAYFILFIFEQLKLDRDVNKIVLLGDIDYQSDLYKLIYKYVRNVEFLDYDFPYQSEILNTVPKHQNFIVLNQF